MNREDIICMAHESHLDVYGLGTDYAKFADALERFYKIAVSSERSACEALHEHEDVQAPIGNSSWGEAYQEGWAQGTAAYRDAIKARE